MGRMRLRECVSCWNILFLCKEQEKKNELLKYIFIWQRDLVYDILRLYYK